MALFLLALITLGHFKYNLYTHIGHYYVISQNCYLILEHLAVEYTTCECELLSVSCLFEFLPEKRTAA